MLRLASVCLVSLTLAGCQTLSEFGNGSSISPAPVAAECSLHTPEFAVRGKTDYDQSWINVTTEGLVEGCNQPRPKARPASMDAPAPKIVYKAPPKAVEPPAVTKRKRWFGF